VPTKLGGERRGGHLKAVDHERTPCRHEGRFETALSAKSISAVANARHVKPHGMAVRNWTMRSTICRAMASLAVLEIGASGPIPGVIRVCAVIREPSYGVRVIGQGFGGSSRRPGRTIPAHAGTSIAAATARAAEILSFMSELVWRVRAGL
jgi:hypothetical protein